MTPSDSSSMGRFLGRDPAGERGGLNLYAFAGNNGVNQLDYLGLALVLWRNLDKSGDIASGGSLPTMVVTAQSDALIRRLGIANDVRQAGLNSSAAFVDSAMDFRFGQSGLALGLTQAAADYIKDLGLSSAQVSGVVNTITQSVAQAQGKLDNRLHAALSECDKQFK